MLQPAASESCCVGGQEITGAVVSNFVTVKLHDVKFPDASVAVNVTVSGPVADTEVPAAGDCVTTIAEPVEQLSLLPASAV